MGESQKGGELRIKKPDFPRARGRTGSDFRLGEEDFGGKRRGAVSNTAQRNFSIYPREEVLQVTEEERKKHFGGGRKERNQCLWVAGRFPFRSEESSSSPTDRNLKKEEDAATITSGSDSVTGERGKRKEETEWYRGENLPIVCQDEKKKEKNPGRRLNVAKRVLRRA